MTSLSEHANHVPTETLGQLRRSRPDECCILLVCTANERRSPIAEALLRRHLTASGVPLVDVRSAGVSAAERRPDDRLIAVVPELTHHLSRRLDTEAVVVADLVLTMDLEQLRAVAVLSPDALHKTFTVREFVRRAGQVGQPWPGETLDAWLNRLSGHRDPTTLLRSVDESVADLRKISRRTIKKLVADIDALAAEVARVLRPALG